MPNRPTQIISSAEKGFCSAFRVAYRFLFCCAVCLFIFACGPYDVSEIEPNDIPARATAIRIDKDDIDYIRADIYFPLPDRKASRNRSEDLSKKQDVVVYMDRNNRPRFSIPGRRMHIRGRFHHARDRDCYMVLSPPGYFKAKIRAIKGINARIEFLGPKNQTVVKYIDDFRKSDEEVYPLKATSGKIGFCVSQSPRDTAKSLPDVYYHIDLSYYRFSLPDSVHIEDEPNDTPDSANAVGPNETIIGSFVPSINMKNISEENIHREEDYYVLTPPEKQPHPLHIQFHLSGVPRIDPVLIAYNQKMEKILTLDNHGINEGETSPTMLLRRNERLYLKVFSKVIRSEDEHLYALSILTRDSENNQETEPNDTFSTANSILTDMIRYEAQFLQKDDVDFIRFHVGPGARSARGFILFPKTVKGGIVEIYNEPGNMLYEFRQSRKRRLAIASVYLPEGMYFIKIYDSLGAITDKKRYRLELRLEKPKKFGEREPNDTLEQANRFSYAKGVLKIGPGSLSSEKDRDYYFVSIEKIPRKRFRFRFTTNSRQPLRLSVTDRHGYILKKETLRKGREMTITETIDGQGYIFVDTPETGVYEPGGIYYIELIPRD